MTLIDVKAAMQAVRFWVVYPTTHSLVPFSMHFRLWRDHYRKMAA